MLKHTWLGGSAALLISLTSLPATAGQALPAESGRAPTVDELITLRRVGSPAMSPDGLRVAYTVRETNWDADAYETEIMLVDRDGGNSRQLTNARRSSRNPAWSPDGHTIAFISDRDDRAQLFLIDARGGEARQVAKHDEGVVRFAWSPDGATLAFSARDPMSEARKARDERYGAFEIEDADLRMQHLFLVDVESQETRRLTSGDFFVGRFSWSPDGAMIAFDHRRDGDPSSSGSADISIVGVSDGSMRPLVTQSGPDSNPVWSPDGSRIAFESAMAEPFFYYRNRDIAVVPATGGAPVVVSGERPENPRVVTWAPRGIYLRVAERTRRSLYRLAPETRSATQLQSPGGLDVSAFSFSRDFATVAYVGAGATVYPEIFAAPVETMESTRLSRLGESVEGWTLGTRELVSWQSRDDTTIEGVLHKPADFVEGRRYPLLVVIHGGPTGTSRAAKVGTSGVYPIDIWLAKGAVVLQPNYRGSEGYGEAFRSLNVRNLGVGDAWDVVSGIEYLVQLGIADEARVGAMGWSQGGYISAFLTTAESSRFRAISVGAGISDWMTYYVNTDIHPFTRQYLKADPWDDPEIYAKTSPITYIKNANTPTLIQHGEDDRRVPLPNAFELYQGLRDQDVPVRLVVFKGFGHGLNKPKAARAAMEQNLEWFAEHLWEETVPASSYSASEPDSQGR